MINKTLIGLAILIIGITAVVIQISHEVKHQDIPPKNLTVQEQLDNLNNVTKSINTPQPVPKVTEKLTVETSKTPVPTIPRQTRQPEPILQTQQPTITPTSSPTPTQSPTITPTSSPTPSQSPTPTITMTPTPEFIGKNGYKIRAGCNIIPKYTPDYKNDDYSYVLSVRDSHQEELNKIQGSTGNGITNSKITGLGNDYQIAINLLDESYSNNVPCQLNSVQVVYKVTGRIVASLPTEYPTATPTEEPTVTPTISPSLTPTPVPTKTVDVGVCIAGVDSPCNDIPTPTPTSTEEPTTAPTEEPTPAPTEEPTPTPTEEPAPAPASTLPSRIYIPIPIDTVSIS